MIEIKVNKAMIEKYYVVGHLTQVLSEIALVCAKFFSDIQKGSANEITYDFLVEQLNATLTVNKESIIKEMMNDKENTDASV